MKKALFAGITLTLLLGGVFAFSNASHPLDNACPFCNEKIVNYQKFYETDLVVALYTHKPVMPGHCLIIPKRHITRFEELSDEEMVEVLHTIKRVDKAVSEVFGTAAYLILQKNGEEVGQTVPHVHFHYIPRQKGDDSTITFLFNFYVAPFKSPLTKEEMGEAVSKLSEAMGSSSQ